MQVIRGLHNPGSLHRGCVMTIGNYDGIHRGHQAVLRALADRGRALSLPVLVMTFEPPPREFFNPDAAPARLSSLREKLEDLATFGVDRVLCVRFDAHVAALPAESFVRDYLVDGVGARVVMVGEDFRFGRGRAGDMALLRAEGKRFGFSTESLGAVSLDGGRVSSTRVRAALAAGDTRTAAKLLGRPYRVTGRVVKGQRLGRQLGFPTANLRFERRPAPRFGVYAVRARVRPDAWRGALVSFGTRPTVDGEGCLLEVYFLDFEGDLYGRRLDVEFLKFLRPEARFDTLDGLIEQMHRDESEARAFFADESV